jgi:hypothetical protein
MGSRAGVLIAHRPNAVVPHLPRLPARLASAERLQFGDFDALQDGVRPMPMADVEPQTAEFFFDLQYFERASGCFLDFSNERRSKSSHMDLKTFQRICNMEHKDISDASISMLWENAKAKITSDLRRHEFKKS